MKPPDARFFFDYVDPLSYLFDLEIQAVEAGSGWVVERVGLEICAPPEPMLDPESTRWVRRGQEAARAASDLGISLTALPLVPWTRKAHELVWHARDKDAGPALHAALFEGVFQNRLDIGRIDVLVGLAAQLGLDPGETKAVLDVDKYSEQVEGTRRDAISSGIAEIPTLVAGEQRLEGFHNRTTLSTFLHAANTPDNTLD
jgi:predicted DsbA family dithiol-disulfide isomerase